MRARHHEEHTKKYLCQIKEGQGEQVEKSEACEIQGKEPGREDVLTLKSSRLFFN